MLNLNKLNKQQRDAVTYGEGPLMVIAGPGSGKTHTIINRINYLIQVKQIPPDKILVITFTRDAAKELQSRFSNEQNNANPPVQFGTFHSVSYGMLITSDIIKKNSFLTNSQKKELIIKICNKAGRDCCISWEGSKKTEPDELLRAISIYKNTLSLANATKALPEQLQGRFPRFLQQYEVLRKQMGRYDFDDLIWDCLIELKTNPLFKDKWKNQFSHILIDEFQDINPIQYSWVKEMVNEKQNIFAVGDDDQSIYGFRGSEPKCMKAFLKDFNSACIILDTNYRSLSKIVIAGNQVIKVNENRIVKEMTAVCESEGKVVKKGFENVEEQLEYILRYIKNKDDYVTAILFRTNIQMHRYAYYLSQKEIPFSMNGKTMQLKDHFIVEDLLTYMKLSVNQNDNELLLKILHKPQRKIPREILLHRDLSVLGEVNRYTEELHKMKLQLNFMKDMPPFVAMQYILKGIGYEKYLKKRGQKNIDKAEEWNEILIVLKHLALGCRETSQWIRKINEFDNLIENGIDANSSKLRLMTMHSAKGLEFDCVIIPDCNEHVYPYGHNLNKLQVEEERRLFYVGITRAKKCLELLYLTDRKESSRQISRFLRDITE